MLFFRLLNMILNEAIDHQVIPHFLRISRFSTSGPGGSENHYHPGKRPPPDIPEVAYINNVEWSTPKNTL